MKKIATPILAVITVALILGIAFIQASLTRVHQENQALRAQLEAAATNNTPDQPTEITPLETNTPTAELIRLRGEVQTLRREKQEAEKLRAENQSLRSAQAAAPATASRAPEKNPNTPKSFPRDSWAFSGFADPESALQSVLWAGASGDAASLLSGLSPEQLVRMQNEDNKTRTEAEVLEKLAKDISRIKSYHVLEARNISENETVLTLFVDGMEGSEQTPRLKMQRVGNEWRLAGPYKKEESKTGQ
jgi:hypothetical protein